MSLVLVRLSRPKSAKLFMYLLDYTKRFDAVRKIRKKHKWFNQQLILTYAFCLDEISVYCKHQQSIQPQVESVQQKNNKIVTFVQLVVELISYSAAAQNVFHDIFSAKTSLYIQPQVEPTHIFNPQATENHHPIQSQVAVSIFFRVSQYKKLKHSKHNSTTG